MITAASLKTYKMKDLAQMAKKRGVVGWHSMRKDQLVQALVRKTHSKHGKSPKSVAVGNAEKNGKTASSKTAKKSRHAISSTSTNPSVLKKIRAAQAERERNMDLSTKSPGKNGRLGTVTVKDRLVLMVRDPYWLQANWEITPNGVHRARAALAEHWHTSRPILRIIELPDAGKRSAVERVWKDIAIHGGVSNWYIDVTDPPGSFRAEIGYRATNDRFHALARSNSVTTPKPGATEIIDGNWADVAANSERIYALSGGYDPTPGSDELQELLEERLRRPLGSPMNTRFGQGAEGILPRKSPLRLNVDAEIVVHGVTSAGAHLTSAGEPVAVNDDGSFTMRLPFPNARKVVPIVATTADGVEEQTVILAVERNTKTMETKIRDQGD